jgi:hypothetical protein
MRCKKNGTFPKGMVRPFSNWRDFENWNFFENVNFWPLFF